MTRQPSFEDPLAFIRFFGPRLDFPSFRPGKAELQFMRLLEREGPIQGQFTYDDVSPGGTNGPQTFTDLEMDEGHIAQVFMGVSLGTQARIFHPNDFRVLDWDVQSLDQFGSENDSAIIQYEDSPIDQPEFEFWVAGGTENFTPAITVRNAASDVVPRRTLDLQVLFLAAKYTFDFVDPVEEADLFRKLDRGIVPSHHASFGGGI